MHHASDIAAFYDHELEGSLAPGRRAAHDWGADDLFDGSRVAGRAHADRRARRPVVDWLAEDERSRVEDWLAGGHSGPVTVGGRDAGDDHDYDFDSADGEAGGLDPSPSAPTLEMDLPLGTVRPARRTVTITGHPEAVRRAQRSGEIARRRPAPTLQSRIGIANRPDRIAMMACALGFLLVLVAILTGSA